MARRHGHRAGGRLLRWTWTENDKHKSVSSRRSVASLRLGSHSLADELRRMRLGRVISSEYRPSFEAVLGPVIESIPTER